MKDENIFQAVQEKYSVKEIAESLGIRLHQVGGSLRANSIFGNGEGKDAFAVYPESGRWHDFMEKKSGDITDLVAIVKFNGDKAEALHYLMPEATPEKIKIQKSQRDEFMKDIERWHNDLMNPNKPMSVRALQYLHSRKISDETIKRLKIGVKSSGPKNQIVFPYWDESGKRVLYFNSRRYNWSGHGEDENEPKYMKASLTAYPFLKNSLWGLHTLDRGNKELYLTEGTFDAIDLDQCGYSVLATNGGDFGKFMPQVIERAKDFQKVIAVFDNDQAGRDFTFKVSSELVKARISNFEVVVSYKVKDVAEMYEKYGNVDIFIDEYSRKGLNWCMEYLRPATSLDHMTAREREKVMERCKSFIKDVAPFTDAADIREMTMCLGSAFPKDWLGELVRIGKKGLDEVEINDLVISQHKLMFNDKCGFYEYEDGIWKQKDDNYVGSYICKALGQFATGGKITSTLRHLKTREEILSDAPLKSFNMLPCLTLMNGTIHFDLETGTVTLKQHSSDDYTTVKMPYRYDDKATHKRWDKFVSEITSNDKKAQKLLKEFAGYLLLPDCRFQKALLLKGEGSNGKSVFVNILKKMLGGSQGYVSFVEPSKLVKDFRLMPFKDSWLNVSSDSESDLSGAEGQFKKLVAGEELEDSYKFKKPFSFPTRSKMVMCCNKFPTVKDVSEGFMRRFLLVEFKKHFVDPDYVRPDKNEMAIDVNLERELEKELPGILNWAIEGLQELLAQGKFTETDEQKKLLKEFVCNSDHIVEFIDDAKKDGVIYEDKGDHLEGKQVKQKDLFRLYRAWAEEGNYYPKSRGKFFTALRSMLKRMNIEFSEDAVFWKFKDINAKWSELGFDDDVDEENEISNGGGNINESEENVNDLVARE